MRLQPVFFVISVIFLLISCATPRYRYQDSLPQTALAEEATRQLRVLATIEDWRDSGIDLIAGNKYHVSATGKWKTYSSCNYTDADGIGLYNSSCFSTPFYPPLLPGLSHSTLVAKIGKNGKVFDIGKEKSWQALTTGRLFFRINDTPNTNWDNDGHVDVTVTKLSSSQMTTSNQLNTNERQSKVDSSLPRFALVIGNANYQQSPLTNPVNDAKDMAKTLKDVGFSVQLSTDATQQQIEEAIDKFARKLTEGGVALFYFAGHGMQINGENYLIPVAADIKRQSDVRYKAVNTGQVLSAMAENNNSLNIIILDACRDNPLPRSFRSSNRGLAKLDGPKGTLLAFATSPGSVAADGENKNGVYTEQLLKHIKTPGLSVEETFKRVLKGVDKITNGRQTPWMESSFTGDFSFIPK